MAAVTITSLAYDSATNLLSLACDFSALGVVPSAITVVMEPEAIGNRIAVHGYANGDEAMSALVLEHAARMAPDATATTVDWQVPSDEEKAAQLDALAGRIEAAQVFFGSSR